MSCPTVAVNVALPPQTTVVVSHATAAPGATGPQGPTGPAGAAILSQTAPPSDHAVIWFDPETATFSVWHVDAWVSVVSSGGSADAASIILALGLPSYASLTAANAALAIGQPYYDTTLAKIQIATA